MTDRFEVNPFVPPYAPPQMGQDAGEGMWQQAQNLHAALEWFVAEATRLLTEASEGSQDPSSSPAARAGEEKP